MADPRDDLDSWMNAQVQPLPPPPGTFELIRKRARRRKATRALAAAAGTAAVIAVIATVPRLVITQLQVGPSRPASGTQAGQTQPAGARHSRPAGTAASSASPSAAPTATVTGPGPVPPNFAATSVTFVGSASGFVLGQAGTPGHCGPPDAYICTSLAGTNDGGQTWHGVKAPVAGAPHGPAGVSQVRFFNTSDGWAFGPQLWATHDGGTTWTQIRTRGLRVTALEAAGRRVFAVWAQCTGSGADFAAQCTSSALYSAAPGSNDWAPVPGAGTGFSVSGTASSAALVLTGTRGYLLPPDGQLLSGPVTGPGGWQPVTGAAAASTPCKPGAAQPDGQPAGALLAATTASGLVLACPGPGTAGTQIKIVYTSADRGQTWHLAGSAPLPGDATSVAGTTAGTIVLATTQGIELSADGGTTWTAAHGGVPPGGFSYVGMTTPDQGVAVPADARLHAVWFTHDGGATWHESRIS